MQRTKLELLRTLTSFRWQLVVGRSSSLPNLAAWIAANGLYKKNKSNLILRFTSCKNKEPQKFWRASRCLDNFKRCLKCKLPKCLPAKISVQAVYPRIGIDLFGDLRNGQIRFTQSKTWLSTNAVKALDCAILLATYSQIFAWQRLTDRQHQNRRNVIETASGDRRVF